MSGRVTSPPSETLETRCRDLPIDPGVYLFKTARRRILYIGKAKSLRQRVRSYFHLDPDRSPRLVRMLAEATDLEVIVTANEVEALVLENQLIKREKPRYNVLLRDDKNYPYVKLTWSDAFPRAVLVRRAALDGHLYFGPYLPARTARRTVRQIARWFQVATCYEKLDGSRPRPCLYYHMKQCLAPCAGLVADDEYRTAAREARWFLEGRNRRLRRQLQERMRQASRREDFETAARCRDLVRLVDRQPERVGLAGVGLTDQDFFAMHRDGPRAVLLVYAMRNGEVRSRREFRFDDLEAADGELLATAIGQFYGAATDIPATVSTDRAVTDADWIERWLGQRTGRRVRLLNPRRGPRRRFLASLAKNACLAFETSFHSARRDEELLEELRDHLGLESPPYRIEAFDISHTGGRGTVASVVVWEGGRPLRSAFRRLRIKQAGGGDDYAAMSEAVGRRCARLIREGKPLPDLILLDGGRGQLSAVERALRAGGVPPVPLAALAKREEKLFVPGRSEPVPLAENSPVQLLVRRIRDEAHRFANQYHARVRRRAMLRTPLLDIPGIGPIRARRLLKTFGSLQGVRRASRPALCRQVGAQLADRIRSQLGR